MMNLLGWLNPYKWLAMGALALALAGVIGGQHIRIGSLTAKLTAKSNELDAAVVRAKQMDKEFRATEAAWAQRQKELTDEAESKLVQARADAAIADAAAGRLQQRVAALVAEARRAATRPAIATPGPATGDALDMLADLQRRLDETAGQLAHLADERGTAGQLCQDAYDALTGSRQ